MKVKGLLIILLCIVALSGPAQASRFFQYEIDTTGEPELNTFEAMQQKIYWAEMNHKSGINLVISSTIFLTAGYIIMGLNAEGPGRRGAEPIAIGFIAVGVAEFIIGMPLMFGGHKAAHRWRENYNNYQMGVGVLNNGQVGLVMRF